MLKKALLHVIGLSIASTGLAAAPAWPMLTYPQGSRIERIADGLRHNGYHLHVHRFQVAQKPDQVIQFFRHSWRNSRPQVARLGDWHTVSKREGDFVTTVEVRAGTAGSSEGISAVRFLQDIRDIKHDIPRDIPLPQGSRVASVLYSRDGDQSAVTLTLLSHMRAQAVTAFYQRELPVRGWTTHGGNAQERGQRAHTLFFDKRGRSGMVQTMDRNGLTQSVLHVDGGP